jgi:23S rRNA pseudouridine955/2504/2580 synthase
MAHIGHPLAGDGKYGDYDTNHEIEKMYGIDEQFLHAREIKFKITKGKLKYLNDIKLVAELSKKDQQILEKIEKEYVEEELKRIRKEGKRT